MWRASLAGQRVADDSVPGGSMYRNSGGRVGDKWLTVWCSNGGPLSLLRNAFGSRGGSRFPRWMAGGLLFTAAVFKTYQLLMSGAMRLSSVCQSGSAGRLPSPRLLSAFGSSPVFARSQYLACR